MPWLGLLLSSLVGSSVARMLTGAGLAIVTFATLTPLVLSAMNAAVQGFSGIAPDILAIMLRSGFGVALSAIGSGMLARVAIDSAKVAVTKGS